MPAAGLLWTRDAGWAKHPRGNNPRLEVDMQEYTPDFSLEVQGVKGTCPAGEVYAKEQLAKERIPVLTC